MDKEFTQVVIERAGGYDELQLQTKPVPKANELKADEVLIKVHGCGVNYADVCVRWGIYASAKKYIGWPITPGFEFSGTVVAKHDCVDKFELDDKVLGVCFFGGYSGYVVVKTWQIYKLLDEYGLSLDQAAAIPAVFLTAYHALYQNIVTRPGMKVLVHSAAGGVGQALVQLAKLLALDITAVVGSSHKVDLVKNKLGVSQVIDKSTQDLWQQASQFAPEGFDIILDANGVSTLKQSYQHLAPMGKLLIYGFHSMLPKKGGKLNAWHWLKLALNAMRTPKFNPLAMTTHNKSIICFNLSFLFRYQYLYSEAMNDILAGFKTKALQAPPITTYPLTEVAKAHQFIESGTSQGKIILKP